MILGCGYLWRFSGGSTKDSERPAHLPQHFFRPTTAAKLPSGNDDNCSTVSSLQAMKKVIPTVAALAAAIPSGINEIQPVCVLIAPDAKKRDQFFGKEVSRAPVSGDEYASVIWAMRNDCKNSDGVAIGTFSLRDGDKPKYRMACVDKSGVFAPNHDKPDETPQMPRYGSGVQQDCDVDSFYCYWEKAMSGGTWWLHSDHKFSCRKCGTKRCGVVCDEVISAVGGGVFSPDYSSYIPKHGCGGRTIETVSETVNSGGAIYEMDVGAFSFHSNGWYKDNVSMNKISNDCLDAVMDSSLAAQKARKICEGKETYKGSLKKTKPADGKASKPTSHTVRRRTTQ